MSLAAVGGASVIRPHVHRRWGASLQAVQGRHGTRERPTLVAPRTTAASGGGVGRGAQSGGRAHRAEDQSWRQRLSKAQSGPTIVQRALGGLLKLPGVPIGSYVAEPVRYLHTIDPRIKQAWLLALLLLPVRASLEVREVVDVLLVLLAVTSLPYSVWKPQLVQLGGLCAFLFVLTACAADAVPAVSSVRAPPPELEGLLALPAASQAYQYVLFKLGPVTVTRRSVALACNTATLSFSMLQSAHLALSTTPPEAMAASLRWYLAPLARLGLPVDEVVLTTLLSLRFMALVFEELRGLAVGVASRGINWKTLAMTDVLDLSVALLRRMLSKLTHHSEVISEAMVARGYRDATSHRLLLQVAPPPRALVANGLALVALAALGGYVVTFGDTL